MPLQTNRIYSLIVGDVKTGDGWEITDLHITFDISKMSDNKQKNNSATIEIYNLSKEKQRFLERKYIGLVLSVGWLDTGLKRLFAGQVTEASTRKSGADVITILNVGVDYVELNHQTISKIVPEGSTYEDVIKEIAKELGTSRNVITGVNCKNPVIDGYPLSGTPRQMLDEVCRANQMDWSIDDKVLYVSDTAESYTTDINSVVVISQSSGLLDRPYLTTGDVNRSVKDKKKKRGLQFRCLIIPELVAGSLIKLEYEELTGYYRIDSMRIKGGWRVDEWFMDIKLTEKIGSV